LKGHQINLKNYWLGARALRWSAKSRRGNCPVVSSSEELGSGVLNVSKYLPLCARGAKPQFVEGNPFITVIPLPAETGVKSPGKGEEKSREKSRDRILKMIRKKPTVTTQEMMDSLGLSRAGVEKIVKKLKQERRISRVGLDKGGHWEVVKDQQP